MCADAGGIKKPLWPFFSLAALLPGAGYAYYVYSKGDRGPADVFDVFLILLWTGWTGAFLGGILDLVIRKRSPLEPIFPRWTSVYRRGFWFRLMLLLPTAWTAFMAIAVAAAVLSGEKKEAAQLLSLEGGLVFIIFLFVFALEGAIVGGLIDLLGRLLKGA
ncbi:MAG: hypothetical protein WA666_02655 [Nitrospirota bacterium]